MLLIHEDIFNPKKAAAITATRPDVETVVPTMPMKLISPKSRTGNVKLNGATNAWGIEATAANTSPFTGEGITVAVLDTGINEKHPAFKGIKFY